MRADFEGFDGLIDQLQLLNRDSSIENVAGKMLFEGAAVIADRIKEGIIALPTAERRGTPEHKIDGVTRAQKAGLVAGFGISKVKKTGDAYDLHIGFNGYNGQRTKKYPNGQPNILIARSVEGGTSFRRAHPFVQPAIRASMSTAQNKMIEAFNKAIDEILK